MVYGDHRVRKGGCITADKTVIILRNDPAKQRKKLGMDRKRLGKVKDLLEAAIDDAQMYEYDIAMGKIKKIKGGEIKHNA